MFATREHDYDGVLIGCHHFMSLKSAAQYELKGLPIESLGNRSIHVRYNVFPPTRKDYLNLFASVLRDRSHAYLPALHNCLDVGTGTGVLSLILCQHGARNVVATDMNKEALINAQMNSSIFGLTDKIRFEQADAFPATEEQFDLIVANPPWISTKAIPEEEEGKREGVQVDATLIDGVVDQGGRFLETLISGAKQRLSSKGKLWLIYSNIAELLGMQDKAWIEQLCHMHGLSVLNRTTSRSRVRLANDDPFREIKRLEQISLYEIGTTPCSM